MRLNLGCGKEKIDGFINIDIRKDVGADYVFDISEGLPFDDDSVEEIVANDFLEHIPIGKTVFVIEEIWRVLRHKGVFKHFTPSTDGRGAFQDPGHKSFWNINSWKYFSDDDPHRISNNIKARFRNRVDDVVTSVEDKIIHTVGRSYAIKD